MRVENILIIPTPHSFIEAMAAVIGILLCVVATFTGIGCLNEVMFVISLFGNIFLYWCRLLSCNNIIVALRIVEKMK